MGVCFVSFDFTQKLIGMTVVTSGVRLVKDDRCCVLLLSVVMIAFKTMVSALLCSTLNVV